MLNNGSHLIINAGPGTGKTLTLTHRIAQDILHNSIRPEQLLALTFTNKAAGEMRERIQALLSGKSAGINISTFHGFCLSVLRADGSNIDIPSDFSLCPEGDSLLLMEDAANETGASRRLLSKFKKEVSDLKMQLTLNNDHGGKYADIMPLFEKYRQYLNENNMLDFNDLEAEALRLFVEHPEISLKYTEKYKRIFIDEYQDTSSIQSMILKHLVKDGINLICAIGDPDQAIYGFRGADIENFFRYSEDFPGTKEIILNKNFRSTDNVLEAAAGILEKEKPLEGVEGKGAFIRISECGTNFEEAEMVVEQVEKILGGTSYFSLDSGRVASHEDGEDNIGFGDISVLYRINSEGDALEEAFTRAGIPFIRSGEKSLTELYPVDVIMRCLQLHLYPENRFYKDKYKEMLGHYELKTDVARREFSTGKTISEIIDDIVISHNFDLTSDAAKKAVSRLKEIASNSSGASSITDILSLERGIDNTVLKGDRVALMSIHAAKGLEWPVVFIVGCEDKLIPLKIFGDSDDYEEKRLFYVGITRAKNRLIFSHAKSRKINNRSIDMKASPYLDLIPEKNLQPLERTQWKPKKREKQLSLF